jgi:glyoxylase-like metal-dependent hydrolase (beta-lactamase superfamily II)
MDIFAVNAENIKVDGGATFGVVPKLIWEKYVKADAHNLIDAALRCMLVKDEGRIIIIDTGCGNKQSEKFYSYIYVTGRDNLKNDFARFGYSFDDVTDVILTHLHYDHCGGALIYNKDRTKLLPAFPNAKYWCSKAQWERANNPHPIEKPSYFMENYQTLMELGLLNLIEEEIQFTPNIYLNIFNGHTAGQVIPFIKYKDRTVVNVSDFIASTAHIKLTTIPAFDYEPLVSLKEKEEFLSKAVQNNYVLFFQHDFYSECCTVTHSEKGFKVKETFKLEEIKNS